MTIFDLTLILVLAACLGLGATTIVFNMSGSHARRSLAVVKPKSQARRTEAENSVTIERGTPRALEPFVALSREQPPVGAKSDTERLAEELDRARSTFIANMSHELRTPLNAVIGFSEIMAKELFGPLGNAQYKNYAEDIYDSGTHLLDLINDILDMSKIEAGKLTLAPRKIDPSSVIAQAVSLTKRKAEEKGLAIIVDAVNLPEIEADPRALKQMLLNLLSNAVKFTDRGSVLVAARGDSAGLTISVADTGVGIPPEHISRLGRPFEQVDGELERTRAGAGLGLALTKSLAELHGGTLTLQSEFGRGTMATLFLPKQAGGVSSGEDRKQA